MTHDEFQIGEDFWCGDRRWRCTDIGTRVIVAICMGSHDVTGVQVSLRGERGMRRVASNSAEWLAGPPYAVSEEVFDEEDIIACAQALNDSEDRIENDERTE